MTRAMTYTLVATLLMAVSGPLQSQDVQPVETMDAAALVQQLRGLPTPLPAMAPSNGIEPPSERLRRQVYDRLLALYPDSIPALAQGFQDPDVRLRRNVALALEVLSGGWWEFSGEHQSVDIRAAMPVLITALRDSDPSVRAWAAQAIGNIGAIAAMAIPELIRLLESKDEGSRNSACIALRGIGSAARSALPALQKALSDPSTDVRQFARFAIDKIESQSP